MSRMAEHGSPLILEIGSAPFSAGIFEGQAIVTLVSSDPDQPRIGQGDTLPQQTGWTETV